MINPYQQSAMKHVSELLGEKFPAHQNTLERCIMPLYTKNDVEQFLQLIVTTYQLGFDKATDSYREHLKKLGYNLTVRHQ